MRLHTTYRPARRPPHPHPKDKDNEQTKKRYTHSVGEAKAKRRYLPVMRTQG